MKILVTGGAGFIGSQLCDRLVSEGHTVTAIDDLSTGRIANLAEARSAGQRFGFQNLDIRSEAMGPLFAKFKPEVVYHLAAQPGVTPSLKNPMHDASVNIIGLINILEASANAGARKIVFASSGGTIYGEGRKLPLKETSRSGSRPTSPYGVTKKVAEEYLRFYQKERDLDYTALALANVYGPRQDAHGESGVIAIFTEQLLQGKAPIIFGDGNQTRDFIFVDDVVHAFALASDKGKGSGKLLNIGTGLEVTVNGLLAMISDIAGVEVTPTYKPAREGELTRNALDATAAKDELGWHPWTHLEDGLAETVAYVREG